MSEAEKGKETNVTKRRSHEGPIENMQTIGQHFQQACKQALCMGYSEICFRIAKGCVREGNLQWTLYNLSSASFSD